MQPPGQRNKVDPNTNKRKSIKPSNTFIPDMDALPATMPVTVHIHSKCFSGPFIDPMRLRTMITAPNHKTLTKLILQEILGSCSDTTQLAPRLFALEGEVNIVTAASKNFTVKIPSSNALSDTELVQFLKIVCQAAEACSNLITLEPGPEKCDICCKQDKLRIVKQEESHSDTESQRLVADDKNTLQTHHKRHIDRASEPKQTYKRRRHSDIDMESSSPSPTSSSSSNSSSSEQFANIAKKSFDEFVSTTTTTTMGNSQKQAVTATSTSG